MLKSKYSYILIYDPDCPLCLRFKQALGFMDTKKNLEFKSVQDPAVYLSYPQLNKEECLDEIHMLSSSGKVFRGADVVSELITIFPGVSKISWLIEKESSKKAADFFYKSLNNIRKAVKKDCPKCNRSKE